SRRRHTRFSRDWSSDVCSSDLIEKLGTQLAQALVDSTPAIVELATSVGDFLVTALDTLGPSLIKVLDALLPVVAAIGTDLLEARSEERRVGKECGAGCAARQRS